MAKKHVHKYYRLDIGVKSPYIVFRCAIPNCAHYVPEKLVINRESICWSCESKFIIAKSNLKPICERCRNKGNDNVEDILKDIGVIS